MRCETCFNEHDGSFGSGRFCSLGCSRSFATKDKREIINRKVSRKLEKGKICNFCGSHWTNVPGDRYHSGRRCPNCRQRANKDVPFEELKGDGSRRARLLRERGHRCEECKNEIWLGKPIPIEMHHIDGNRENRSKENLKLLCPNCHALTPNFGWKKKHITPSDATGVAVRLSSG